MTRGPRRLALRAYRWLVKAILYDGESRYVVTDGTSDPFAPAVVVDLSDGSVSRTPVSLGSFISHAEPGDWSNPDRSGSALRAGSLAAQAHPDGLAFPDRP